MDQREHAWLARQLINACGGPTGASQRCRLAKSLLSECCDANVVACLPADVIVELEAYCGQPIYSRAMHERRPDMLEPADIVTVACETAEEAAALQRLVRLADGAAMTRLQREALAEGLASIERQLRQLEAEALKVLP